METILFQIKVVFFSLPASILKLPCLKDCAFLPLLVPLTYSPFPWLPRPALGRAGHVAHPLVLCACLLPSANISGTCIGFRGSELSKKDRPEVLTLVFFESSTDKELVTVANTPVACAVTNLSTLRASSLPQLSYEVGVISIYRRRLKSRGTRWLVQDHAHSKQLSWDAYLGCPQSLILLQNAKLPNRPPDDPQEALFRWRNKLK